MSFTLTQPCHLPKAPMDWPDIDGITLDEFFLFDKDLVVEMSRSNERCYKTIRIEDACKCMRKKAKHSGDSHLFTVNISMHETLDEQFIVPELVDETSLFPKHYPEYKLSKYLRKNYKFFQAFQEEYKSSPNVSYGGLAEWLYVTTGQLDVNLYRPTKLNIMRYHALEDGETLRGEQGTCMKFELKAGSLFTIPPGWISVRETKKSAFTYGGKTLSILDVPNQLEALERDISYSNNLYASDRDSEIRSLYWFLTINVVKSHSGKPASDPSIAILETLRKHLSEWRIKHRKCQLDRLSCLSPEVFAPEGIKLDTILKDIGSLVRHRRNALGKSLHSDKNSIDVGVTQASVDDKSD